jgi:aspartate/glutamate racemase
MVVATEQVLIPSLPIEDPTADKIMQAGLKVDGLLETRQQKRGSSL